MDKKTQWNWLRGPMDALAFRLAEDISSEVYDEAASRLISMGMYIAERQLIAEFRLTKP